MIFKGNSTKDLPDKSTTRFVIFLNLLNSDPETSFGRKRKWVRPYVLDEKMVAFRLISFSDKKEIKRRFRVDKR